MTTRFIQIHTLTPYHASLLNRDDAGFAKRIPFGGAVRTRISSQCLKRHWRRHGLTSEGIPDGVTPDSLANISGMDLAIRSRITFDREIRAPLIGLGVSAEIAEVATNWVRDAVLGESGESAPPAEEGSAKGKKTKEVRDQPSATEQVTVLGKVELAYLLHVAATVAKLIGEGTALQTDKKKRAKQIKDIIKSEIDAGNLQALKRGAEGLDAAVFGRMVTSDILSRTDAAVHVAHAFTVHAEDSESDYFSAIDDLTADAGELGSGHINSTELTTGLFYSYVCIDLGQLRKNLIGVNHDDETVAEVVRRLIHTIASVSPGAKKGSTAPFSRAHCVLVEVGDAQPRSLANAFLKPVSERPDVLANAYAALGGHLAEMDGMYATGEQRKGAAIGPKGKLGLPEAALAASLAEVADFAALATME